MNERRGIDEMRIAWDVGLEILNLGQLQRARRSGPFETIYGRKLFVDGIGLSIHHGRATLYNATAVRFSLLRDSCNSIVRFLTSTSYTQLNIDEPGYAHNPNYD